MASRAAERLRDMLPVGRTAPAIDEEALNTHFIPLLDGEVNSYIHVSDKNANRLPDYHRLDLSASSDS